MTLLLNACVDADGTQNIRQQERNDLSPLGRQCYLEILVLVFTQMERSDSGSEGAMTPSTVYAREVAQLFVAGRKKSATEKRSALGTAAAPPALKPGTESSAASSTRGSPHAVGVGGLWCAACSGCEWDVWHAVGGRGCGVAVG